MARPHRWFSRATLRWRTLPLAAKFFVSVLVLMSLSLGVGVFSFSVGTMLTQRELLQQQADADIARIVQVLGNRSENVKAAARMLADDPAVAQALAEDSGEAAHTLNQRAVVVRDRMRLDLVQIADQRGAERLNLLISSLYRQSPLSEAVASDGLRVYPSEGRLLLLSRAAVADGAGVVVVGIDLETELKRIIAEYRLQADLGLQYGEARLATQAAMPYDEAEGLHRERQ